MYLQTINPRHHFGCYINLNFATTNSTWEIQFHMQNQINHKFMYIFVEKKNLYVIPEKVQNWYIYKQLTRNFIIITARQNKTILTRNVNK